jgi:hypothetical protein
MTKLSRQLNHFFDSRLKPGKILIWCFGLAIFFILIYDFCLLQIPEFFKGGYKFGSIFYRISFAFVTSYIFYWVNVILKKKEDKKNLSPYLANKTYFIVQKTKNLFSEISSVSGSTFNSPYPTEGELTQACKQISPNSSARMAKVVRGLTPYLAPLNWIEYLYNYHIEMNEAIQKIFDLMPHLESKHIKILNDISESSFSKIAYADMLEISEGPLKKPDLTAWSNRLFLLGLMVQSLEEYYDQKLKPFSPGFSKNMS